jgi:hypothetical protein
LVVFLALGAMVVRRGRLGGAFLGLFFGLGMAAWAAFAFSGGRLDRWIEAELAYWEEAVGSLAVGAVLVLLALAVVHLLLWLARRMAAGPRRPDTSAVTPGLDAPAGPGNDWDVFSGDSGGDCGGGTD